MYLSWFMSNVLLCRGSIFQMEKEMLLPHEHRHPNHSLVYKPGFGPYPVQDVDPSFRKCFNHFGPSEYTIWAVTTVVPSYLGFRVTGTRTFTVVHPHFSGVGSVRNPNFLFGLVSGASAGLIYAYVRSYSMISSFGL